jgi:hypothetical protein
MIENNKFKPAYDADSIGLSNLSSNKISDEKMLHISQYLCGLNFLEGHKKIEKEHNFPRFNPTMEDCSRLVNLLNKHGFSLD